jgi:3',5'-cyclic AMP phosphodiesterase CpdA
MSLARRNIRWLELIPVTFLALASCGEFARRRDGAAASKDTGIRVPDAGASREDAGAVDATSDEILTDAGADAELLLGAPLAFAPTTRSFGLNAIVAKGYPSALLARVRPVSTSTWGTQIPATVLGLDVAQWRFHGLAPGTRYEYEILATSSSGTRPLYAGSATTQKPAGQPFTFALLSDPHIGSDLTYGNQGNPETLKAVSAEIEANAPDFMLNLGDMLDFHEFGFNLPPPDGSITRDAYLNYRTLLGDTLGNTPHFLTIGNWDGENGDYTFEEIAWSREQRLLYLPGPGPSTYPEGGSLYQDYYAFTWGDALFIVLNVMTYTPTPHELDSDPGLPDDWTLGADQLAWLRTTLATATSTWRFLFIHHPVGGNAGDESNSAYGRGGGRAAYVGEQATVHQLMQQYGVQIFFYGHDHVFTDMTVDGIHYSEPGSAGAPWHFEESITGYSQSWLDSGWARVSVAPDRVDVQFIKMGDGVIYEYSLP